MKDLTVSRPVRNTALATAEGFGVLLFMNNIPVKAFGGLVAFGIDRPEGLAVGAFYRQHDAAERFDDSLSSAGPYNIDEGLVF